MRIFWPDGDCTLNAHSSIEFGISLASAFWMRFAGGATTAPLAVTTRRCRQTSFAGKKIIVYYLWLLGLMLTTQTMASLSQFDSRTCKRAWHSVLFQCSSSVCNAIARDLYCIDERASSVCVCVLTAFSPPASVQIASTWYVWDTVRCGILRSIDINFKLDRHWKIQ